MLIIQSINKSFSNLFFRKCHANVSQCSTVSMEFGKMMEKSGASSETSDIQDYVNEIYSTPKFRDFFDKATNDLVEEWGLKPDFSYYDDKIDIAKEHARYWNTKVSFPLSQLIVMDQTPFYRTLNELERVHQLVIKLEHPILGFE